MSLFVQSTIRTELSNVGHQPFILRLLLLIVLLFIYGNFITVCNTFYIPTLFLVLALVGFEPTDRFLRDFLFVNLSLDLLVCLHRYTFRFPSRNRVVPWSLTIPGPDPFRPTQVTGHACLAPLFPVYSSPWLTLV